MMKNKTIQVSEEWFWQVVQYWEKNKPQGKLAEQIYKGIDEKLTKLRYHDLYTKSKTASSDEEKEQARQQYLDARGITESFRWNESHNTAFKKHDNQMGESISPDLTITGEEKKSKLNVNINDAVSTISSIHNEDTPKFKVPKRKTLDDLFK